MRTVLAVLLLAASIPLRAGAPAAAAPPAAPKLTYPPARRADVADEYHGMKVPDPYRPLEDPDSPETRAWIEAENRLAFSWLGEIPARPWIRKRLELIWNHEKFGIPVRRGPPGGGGPRHAPVPPLHDRLGMGFGLRHLG
jgi:prolyl oligopeptidase